MSWCNDNWYETVFYDNERWSVIQPKKSICHQNPDHSQTETVTSTSPWLIEFGTTMQLQFLLGAGFLLFVLYRSCSRTMVDPYRLILVYLVCTMPFMLALVLGPGTGGFHRLIGYAVLIHNLAEWFIINRIWIGRFAGNSLLSILYVTIFLVGICFVPLAPLYSIAMFQGAFCDYCLLITFSKTSDWLKKHNNPEGAKYLHIAMAASILHLFSIQPLFFGLALAYQTLLFMTTMFLVPTFILYTVFAIGVSGHQTSNILNPAFGYNVAGLQLSQKTNELLEKLLISSRRKKDDAYYDDDDENRSPHDDVVVAEQKESQVLLQVTNNNEEAAATGTGDGDDVEMEIVAKQTTEQIQDRKQSMAVTAKVDEIMADFCEEYQAHGGDLEKVDLKRSLQGKDFFYALIIGGLANIDPEMKIWQKRIYAISTVCAIINTLLVIFSPCYLDFSATICG
jgi:hypothetical protein